jgi:hypothetical protein
MRGKHLLFLVPFHCFPAAALAPDLSKIARMEQATGVPGIAALAPVCSPRSYP